METFENASHSFVNMLLITMIFKVTIGALLIAINKTLCFEKGVNNTVLLEQCERVSFSWLIYLKQSNVNGQRFHQQKRIEMKTELSERSLSYFAVT